MSELHFMKRDMKPPEQRRQESIMESERPEFPHGLTIHLGEEEMEKLGFNGMPGVGDKFHMKAFLEVKNIGQNESVLGGKDRSMTLQITHMKLNHAQEDRTPDQILFGQPPKPRVIG